MRNFQVAIDGPAGSGKSSISEIISKRIGFTHIDTGAMYRAVTLEAMRRGIDLGDESQYNFIDSINLIYKDDKTLLEGEDVSNEIRSIPVTRNVSLVSSLKRVRDKMVYFQRESAKHGLVLMDGRDIGTVVLPNADVKIFLTASPEERAKRRLKELVEKGVPSDYETVLEDIKVRDYKDSHRAIAPLTKASDAVEVDTTSMTIDEVCDRIIEVVNERMK
ncbi:MAG: (d)CMP kinase [Acholeplasmatales bacterium]|nr:(d)CMP kinase [Acholeplasmatales bacterium]